MRRATRRAAFIAVTLFAGATTDLAGQPAKTDYSAPAGAPYTAIDVTIPTPSGHTLAGTLTLPKFASRARPVGAIVTVTGSGQQDRGEYLGLEGYRPFRQYADSLVAAELRCCGRTIAEAGASYGTSKGATSADFAEDVRVTTPVLILTGLNDQQAQANEVGDQAAAFRMAGNRDVTGRIVPDVNHLFVHDKDGCPANYAKLKSPVMVDPVVVGTVVDWLEARLK